MVLRAQITKLLRDELGVDFHPHLFRHLAAGLYLDENPGAYEEVRRLLGHSRIETTIQFYAGAETKAAVRRYDAMVLRLRQGPPPRWGAAR